MSEHWTILAALRYTDAPVSGNYELTAPPTPLNQSGAFARSVNSTDGIVGVLEGSCGFLVT